ncbi:MAG: sodium:solute symporter family protein [Holophagae bacterium]
MNTPALILLAIYGLALIGLSIGRRNSSGLEFLLAGRRLTLPAFIATLVTTWYGGILGIGEYAWSFGVSTWVVFGIPYYLAAVLFAFVLAPRLRRTDAITIPDLLQSAYGKGAALTGAVGVYAGTVPIAYVLMLAVLLAQITGMSVPVAAIVAAVISAIYVGLSGFRAVVRTDILQLVLMFGGFLVLLPIAVSTIGGFGELWRALPTSHRSWDGGLGWQTVLVWYLIALQTVVEPSFYQRVFAASSPRNARLGVLFSVVLWIAFDFLTIFTGLAARVLLPELGDPMTAYPALAELVLSPWMAALFTVSLVAIVMSTLDSYLFIAATTVGHDLFGRAGDLSRDTHRTRLGLAATALLAAVGAMIFESAVAVWHHVGSVVTASLLLPVLTVHLPRRWRPTQASVVVAMIAAAAVATGWILAGSDGSYPLLVEPLFPALAASAICLLGGRADIPHRSS